MTCLLVLHACAQLVPPRKPPISVRRSEPPPELCVYRDRTCALLRKYFRLALETGRLPSLLGREFFRTQVTSYTTTTFEDAVIFTYDVERCLQQLDWFSQQLIARIVLQEYTEEETARLLRVTCRTVERRYPEALDEMTELLLSARLLDPVPCQEGKNLDSSASCCNETK